MKHINMDNKSTSHSAGPTSIPIPMHRSYTSHTPSTAPIPMQRSITTSQGYIPPSHPNDPFLLHMLLSQSAPCPSLYMRTPDSSLTPTPELFNQPFYPPVNTPPLENLLSQHLKSEFEFLDIGSLEDILNQMERE